MIDQDLWASRAGPSCSCRRSEAEQDSPRPHRSQGARPPAPSCLKGCRGSPLVLSSFSDHLQPASADCSPCNWAAFRSLPSPCCWPLEGGCRTYLGPRPVVPWSEEAYLRASDIGWEGGPTELQRAGARCHNFPLVPDGWVESLAADCELLAWPNLDKKLAARHLPSINHPMSILTLQAIVSNCQMHIATAQMFLQVGVQLGVLVG